MINTNKITKNLSDNIVITPPIVAEEIYNTLKRKQVHNILDVGAYRGDLTKPFKKKKNTKIIGIDVIDDYKNNFDYFMHKDFLKTTKKDFENLNIDLVITNPPFKKNPETGNLYPQDFLQHIFKIFGKKMPVVCIVPNYFLYNSKKRMEYLKKLNLTKNTIIHKDVFPDVKIECNILYFNIKTKTKHNFLGPEKKEKKKRYFKSIALTEEQYKFIKNNIPNFNKYIKSLLKKEFKEFPL